MGQSKYTLGNGSGGEAIKLYLWGIGGRGGAIKMYFGEHLVKGESRLNMSSLNP